MRLSQAENPVPAVPAWPGEVRGCPGARTLQLPGWDGSSKPCSQLRHGLKQIPSALQDALEPTLNSTRASWSYVVRCPASWQSGDVSAGQLRSCSAAGKRDFTQRWEGSALIGEGVRGEAMPSPRWHCSQVGLVGSTRRWPCQRGRGREPCRLPTEERSVKPLAPKHHESLCLLQAVQLQPSGHQTFPPTNLLLRSTPPPCFGETNEVPGARLGAPSASPLIPTRGAAAGTSSTLQGTEPPARSPRVPGGLVQPVSLTAMQQPLSLCKLPRG